MVLNEEILYHIWQHKQFSFLDLFTAQGEEVRILQSGQRNYNSGPDFSFARIKINDTIWAGDVEIHIKSSDWYLHKHHEDINYDKVILHVVWENDKEIIRSDNSIIPSIELKGKVKKHILNRYFILISSRKKIPCQDFISEVEQIRINYMLDRALVERLESKSSFIQDILKSSTNDWEFVLYSMVGRYLFGSINKWAFESVFSYRLYKILKKEKDSLLSIESILFGVSGMLNDSFDEEYPSLIKEKYYFLKSKYNLDEYDSSIWKYMRMFPSNFPTIRISQFSRLINNNPDLFSKFKEANSINEISKYLLSQASGYWNNHYKFGKKTTNSRVKSLGKTAIQSILINAILPVFYNYGVSINSNDLKIKSLDYLHNIGPEKNKYTKLWDGIGVKAKDAFETQALLQLIISYCENKKCLNCTIGNEIIHKL